VRRRRWCGEDVGAEKTLVPWEKTLVPCTFTRAMDAGAIQNGNDAGAMGMTLGPSKIITSVGNQCFVSTIMHFKPVVGDGFTWTSIVGK